MFHLQGRSVHLFPFGLFSAQGTAGLEVTAYEEMSSLVNYIQPIKFNSFEVSASKSGSVPLESGTICASWLCLSPMQNRDWACLAPKCNLLFLEKNRSYVISSFTEMKACDLLSKFPMQFVEYPFGSPFPVPLGAWSVREILDRMHPAVANVKAARCFSLSEKCMDKDLSLSGVLSGRF